MDLFLNSDIENLLLKTDGGKDIKPNFAIFVVWSALIIGEYVVVAWGRKCCKSRQKLHLWSYWFNVRMVDAGFKISSFSFRCKSRIGRFCI